MVVETSVAADGASITTFPFVFALDGRKEENDDGVSLVTERDERSLCP